MPTDPGHKDTWGSSRKYADAFERYQERKRQREFEEALRRVRVVYYIDCPEDMLYFMHDPWVDHGGES